MRVWWTLMMFPWCILTYPSYLIVRSKGIFGRVRVRKSSPRPWLRFSSTNDTKDHSCFGGATWRVKKDSRSSHCSHCFIRVTHPTSLTHKQPCICASFFTVMFVIASIFMQEFVKWASPILTPFIPELAPSDTANDARVHWFSTVLCCPSRWHIHSIIDVSKSTYCSLNYPCLMIITKSEVHAILACVYTWPLKQPRKLLLECHIPWFRRTCFTHHNGVPFVAY